MSPHATFLAATLVAYLISATPGTAESRLEAAMKFIGMCDASAAILAGGSHLVVANDEDNALRVYDIHKGGTATQAIDLNRFPGFDAKKEADLEAVTMLGDTVFWIGSHGRTKKGKESPSRQVFFASKLSVRGGSVELDVIGSPYRHLLSDLIEHPKLTKFGIEQASQRAPKDKGGLNIEGLTATPTGELLIGFRNPVPEGKALLLPLLNPNEVAIGDRARLGNPILLDLGGLAIRDIVLSGDKYLILAGEFDGGDTSRLFEWDGKRSVKMLKELRLGAGKPEAIVLETGPLTTLRILTDNGSAMIDGVACKDLKDSDKKCFECFSVNVR